SEHYRNLLETIPHGIEEIDTSGTIVLANTAHHRQYEYPEGELVGSSIFDHAANSSEREELREHLKHLVREQPTPTPYVGKKRTRNGKILDVEIDWNYQRDNEGRLTGFTSIVTDVTARRIAEVALRESHDRLEHHVEERTADLAQSNAALEQEIIERKKIEEDLRKSVIERNQKRGELAHVLRVATMSELTAALAHEINQPLTAIRMNAQAVKRLMKSDALDFQEFGEIIDDIVDDNRRAAEIIHHMRALLVKHKVDAQLLNIDKIIDEVIGLIHSDAVIKGVEVALDLVEDLPQVSGDGIQLQQVFLNLILNGFDAMQNVPIGERRLVIQTALQGENAICVSVLDTGVGFNERDADRLFEPFHTTKADGLGMGLAINRSIIEAHGGKIWACKNADRGATFQFTLPVLSK
ncbi:MAG: ATP-binding protein, partial [Gammaproteobacteria bacterium]|nr:ATP-binding protein [Gammaproteobacteria bacterium]